MKTVNLSFYTIKEDLYIFRYNLFTDRLKILFSLNNIAKKSQINFNIKLIKLFILKKIIMFYF